MAEGGKSATFATAEAEFTKVAASLSRKISKVSAAVHTGVWLCREPRWWRWRAAEQRRLEGWVVPCGRPCGRPAHCRPPTSRLLTRFNPALHTCAEERKTAEGDANRLIKKAQQAVRRTADVGR